MWIILDELLKNFNVSRRTAFRKMDTGDWEWGECGVGRNGKPKRKILVASLPLDYQSQWQQLQAESAASQESESHEVKVAELYDEMGEKLRAVLSRFSPPDFKPEQRRAIESRCVQMARLCDQALRVMQDLKARREMVKRAAGGKVEFNRELVALAAQTGSSDPVYLQMYPRSAAPLSVRGFVTIVRRYQNEGPSVFAHKGQNLRPDVDGRFVTVPPDAIDWLKGNMAEPAFTIHVETKAGKWDEALRQRLIAFGKLYKWSYGQISRDMQRFHGRRKDKDGRARNVGIGEGSLYRYAHLKWAGSPEALSRLENKVRLWLDHREAQGKVDDIDESVSATRLIMNGVEEAAQSCKFVVIIGPSGMGKTVITKHFANTKTRGGVVMVECYDGMRPRAFLRGICRAIGEVASGEIDDLITRAAECLEAQPLVLAIDEANFLRVMSVNHLIRIWNSAKNGLELLGTEELERVITSPRLQRLRSRLKVMIHREVNGRVVEVARIGSFGSFRDLDTIIEAAIEAREQNPDKSLEAVFERVAGRKTDRRKRKN